MGDSTPPPVEVESTRKSGGGVLKAFTPTPTRKVKPSALANPLTERLIATVECMGKRVTVPVTYDRSVQPPTLSWAQPVKLPVLVDSKPAVLPPGSCNLYTYPKCSFSHLRQGKVVNPSIEQLYVLEELIRALMLDEDETVCIANKRDVVGAAPLHGLVVANTKPALGLALAIYRSKPALLQLCHSNAAVFTGENVLHILCVNSREEELCECIELAASRLKTSQLTEVFQKQASGVFFQAEPMSYYGGTPVSYAVAFSLMEALRTMLRCSKQYPAMSGVIDFNDPAKSACKITGLMPLHVAVANSLTSMVNFLIDLPGLTLEYDDMRARPKIVSQYGMKTNLSMLLPLQVAAKLGDKKLVQYILRTQSKPEWVWGPVSSYNLDLFGIDSVGDTANDFMEIVARLDALEETQEMLLDDFMGGLLNELFMEKFFKVGWTRLLHRLMRAIEIIYVASNATTAIWLRENPDMVLSPQGTDIASRIVSVMPYVTLASIAPLLEEDIRVAWEWWRVARSGPQDAESKRLLKEGGMQGRATLLRRDLSMLLQWMASHNMHMKWFGFFFGALAAGMLIYMRTWDAQNPPWYDETFFSARERTDILLIPLAFASVCGIGTFFSALLFPYETINVYYKMVFRMLNNDVYYWVLLFIIFLLNYGLVMYITYPRFIPDLTNNLTAIPDIITSTTYTEPSPRFNSFLGALQSLVELAFIGEPLEIEFETGMLQGIEAGQGGRGFMKFGLFLLFILFYLYYIIMSLVLLLNLLIAMMSDTYTTSKEISTRLHRVNFARRVLRLEMQLMVFNRCGLMTLNCGTKIGSGKDAIWVHNYRNYTPNKEGGGTRGAPPPMFDEEVEQEADEDEKDDDGPGAVDLDEAHQKKKTAVLQKQQTQALSGGNSMRTLGKAVVSVVAAPSAAITSPRGNGSVVEDLEEEFLGE